MTIYFIIAAGVLLVAVGAAIKALSDSGTIKGITGERLVKAALEGELDPGAFRILHDVTLPSRDGTTQIDHVVLSPYGIFTLETKHLSGWIFAPAGGKTWFQTFGNNNKFRFQNPLRQNHAHVKALEAVTGLGFDAFLPLVVMTGKAEFKTAIPKGVVQLAGMIDWIGSDFGGDVVEVDPGAMTVSIDGEVTNVDVCNVIPAMKAGRIAEIAGVTDGNWAPVNAADMSTKADPDIYVLGDAASQGDMPKSGFAANSQAKVCANAVRGALTGSKVFPAKFSNTCWSLIASEDGVKVGANYEATEEKIAKTDGFISQTGEDAALRKQTYEESVGWYAGITSDMFG